MRYALLVLTFLSGAARADVYDWCIGGPCTYPDPIYVNLYWDTTVQKWNQDVAANDPSMTVDRIDALTAAICHSAYFSQLRQYGIHSCSVGPSVMAGGCAPPPANLDQADDQMAAIANCVLGSHPEIDVHRVIFNVLMPPQVVPSSPDAEFCSTAGAKHNSWDDTDAIETYIPTFPKCSNGISLLLHHMSHEMVEAATDPYAGSGWTTLGFSTSEIGDLCSPSFTNFLYGSVAQYWSNQNPNGCIDGIHSAISFTPSVTSASACGSGPQMRITLEGVFGTVPWDLAASHAGGSKTLFLRAKVGPNRFGAGGFEEFPADPIGLGHIAWTHPPTGSNPPLDKIVISGFDSDYRKPITAGGAPAVVKPGDRVDVVVSSWLTGQSVTASVTAGSATRAASFGVSPAQWSTFPMYSGDTAVVAGKIVDAGSCGVSDVTVKLSASDSAHNVLASDKLTAGDDGGFSTNYTPSGAAGPRTITMTAPVSASAHVDVHPLASSLSRVIGDVAGGQVITLTGAGFASGVTTVSFRGPNDAAPATAVSVPHGDTIHLTTPRSPLDGHAPGAAQVVVTVNGLKSAELSYLYVTPGAPVLNFTSNPCKPIVKGPPINTLEVDTYTAGGQPMPEGLLLVGPAQSLVSPTGGFVSSLNLASGTSVGIVGAGPFTASVVGKPDLTASGNFVQGPTHNCGPKLQDYGVNTSYLQGPGPVESAVVNPVVSATDRSMAWNVRAGGRQVLAALVVRKADAQGFTAAQQLTVRTVGKTELRTLARERPAAYAHADQALHHVDLLGPALALSGRAATQDGLLRSPAMLSFRVPARLAKGACVLRTDATGSRWLEVPSALAPGGLDLVRAQVTDGAIYALARFTP